MAVEILVSRLYPWALLPSKNRIDRALERESAEIYAKHFRYERRVRSAVFCPPWVMGQELGWFIPSPIDITMEPLDDVQFTAESDTEVATVGRMLNRTEVWNRGTGWIATSSNGWLRLPQFKGAGDSWEGMFLPNGEGTVEWRLGWAARIPEEMFLLITGVDAGPLRVPTGVMTAKQVNRTAEIGGMSIAVRPVRRTVITRGEPVARMVLLPREALQAVCIEEEP